MFGTDVITISLPASSSRAKAAPDGAGGQKTSVSLIGKLAPTSVAGMNLAEADPAYIAGPENRFVGAAAQWLLTGVERCYSPLVLHGPSGSGKSLLAQGLAEARKNAGQQNVVFTHGADFVREVAAAIDQNSLAEFRCRTRAADLLVLDDLTDLIDRRAAQRELLGTLDALELRDVPVVITSRVPPSELADLPAALRSRLAGGLQLALAPPGLAARIEILNRLATAREIEVEPAAVQLLAEQLTGSVPEMQGVLHELAAHCRRAVLASENQQDSGNRSASPFAITVDQARQYLAIRRTRSQPTIDKITKVVAKYYGLKPAKLDGPSRQRQVSLARSIAIYLGRQLTGQSLQSLGKHFGNRDHSTVLYSVRTLESRLQTDADLQTAITNLRTLLNAA